MPRRAQGESRQLQWEGGKERVTDPGECRQLLVEVRQFQEGAERHMKEQRRISVMVTKISIRDILEQTERLVRENCPKSQRRGIPFHVVGPGTPV